MHTRPADSVCTNSSVLTSSLCQVADRRPGTVRPLAARLGGVDIPNQKRIETSLQYIYGIGLVRAKEILEATVSPDYHSTVAVPSAHPVVPCSLNAQGYHTCDTPHSLTLKCAEH